MDKFLKSFTNKKFRYGAFSTLMAIIVIGVLVAANLAVSQFQLKFDLTRDKKYSISENTIEVLDNLQKDVTIYTLFRTGQEDLTYTEILDQYQRKSDKITVINKDPFIYKTFVDQYKKPEQNVPVNSIIVECGGRSKIIPEDELVTYQVDYNTFTQYPTTLNIEPKTTNAIVYVTQDASYKIYAVTGHNENPISDVLQDMLDEANFDYETLDLMKSDVPEDCSALLITTPQRDYSSDEVEKVLNYVQNGGRAIAFLDKTGYSLDNVKSILTAYGVEVDNRYIYEGDASRFYQNNRVLIPMLSDHQITKDIIAYGYSVLVPDSQGISTLDFKKNSITVEPLLTTTKNSFGKDNPEAQSTNKEQGDADGPFNIGVAVTDTFFTANEAHTSKLVVIGSSVMLMDAVNGSSYGLNGYFFVQSLNWLTDKTEADSVYVPSKSLQNYDTLSMSAQQQMVAMVFAIIIIPVVILGAGLTIWLRRRNQ